MRRALRIARWGAIGIAGLTLLAVIAAVIVVQTSWFHGKVRERIVFEIERATGGRAEIASFQFQWRTLTASLRNLAIHGTEPAGAPPLFHAESITVGLRIVSVLKKQVDIQSLVVARPRIHLIVNPDGTTNMPKPKTPRKPGRGALATILDLAIKRFHLTDGFVEVDMRRMPLNVAGENLRAQIFYETAPERYRGDVTFQNVNLTPGQIKTIAFDLGAKFAVERNRLDIVAVHLGFRKSTLDVRGAIEDFSKPRINLKYAARVNFEDVTPALRVAALPNRGALALGGEVSVSETGGYDLRGGLKATGLAFEQRGFMVKNVGIASDVVVTRDRIVLPNLAISALGGKLAGSAELARFAEFRVDATVSGFSIHDLTHLQGVEHADWNGAISGPFHVAGVIRGGRVADLSARARMTISPQPGPNPVEGMVELTHSRRAGTIEFERSYFATRRSQAQFSGTLGKRMEVAFQSNDLADIEPAIKLLGGDPSKIPVRLEKGLARFQGIVSGPLRNPGIQGRASLRNFIVWNRSVERLDADVTVSRTGMSTPNLSVGKIGMTATGTVQVGFRNWRPERTEPLTGTISVRSPNLETALAEVGAKAPATGGEVTGALKLGGTIGSPEVTGRVLASKAVLWGQPFDSIEGQVRVTENLIGMTAGHARIGPSRVEVAGFYEHPEGNWREGRLRFDVATKDVPLARFDLVQRHIPAIQGSVETKLAGDVMVDRAGLRPAAVNGWVVLNSLALNREPLGSLRIEASTEGTALDVGIGGELAKSKIAGRAGVSLEGDYPVKGRLDFSEMQFSTLVAQLGRDPRGERPPFDGFAAGRVEFAGSTLNRQSWTAQFELSTFEVRPAAGEHALPNIRELSLRNAGPIVIDADSRGARIREARLRGRETDLTLTGRATFGVRNPWDFRVRGGVNLALLRTFENRLYSSGAIALDVTIRGALRRPDVYGRIDLKNASLNLAGFPNGIDNANGLIFLYRDRATIETLTAETGGGKLSATGFVGFSPATTYHIQAKADGVRVRYPEGVSSTSNATLTLTGTLERSMLSGEATVSRVGFNPRSDLGSILARSSEPVQTPQRQGRFFQNTQLDVHIVTSPQTRFETQLTKDVQADADLRVRGSLARPVVLGRVAITQGEVLFYGSRYTINAGQVLFVNPAKIEPIVNLDLETRTRGIEVTLHVTGPADKMNVSYRSDPPLPFSDIVALLATGREPLGAPGYSGSQPLASQGWEQRGASALVTQAIASPIAGRLQRFFGVSRLKIDPQITGVTTNNATARVTLEQQITNNITFTYITDLSRAQAQTIRVEWDFTRSWSGVALREENGLFGIDFLYKKQFK